MCRFVAYLGKNILLEDIIVKPSNSLTKQSLMARESRTLTNGDGFGLGWYTQFGSVPALFTSLFPAWNDQNLLYLAKKTKASLFFAHVRAATTGGISQYNCHPFLFKHWLFMHNGWIPKFERIKREVHTMLDDDLYNWIKGNTDSEVIFALFLQLARKNGTETVEDIAGTLEETLSVLTELSKKHNPRAVSHFNICITDGKRLVAFRYCTSKTTRPETMYISLGKGVSGVKSSFASIKKGINPEQLIVASEKLTKSGLDWFLIPANSCLMADSNLHISFKQLS